MAVIALELGASVMILTGFYRWLAALALAGFTLMATLIALRFWELPVGHERFMAANAFSARMPIKNREDLALGSLQNRGKL
jgi:uncharacterized membrane protein YphA (DoxX/SURF4 family)